MYAFPKLQHALPSPILQNSSKLTCSYLKESCVWNKSYLAVIKGINNALGLFGLSYKEHSILTLETY